MSTSTGVSKYSITGTHYSSTYVGVNIWCRAGESCSVKSIFAYSLSQIGLYRNPLFSDKTTQPVSCMHCIDPLSLFVAIVLSTYASIGSSCCLSGQLHLDALSTKWY